MILTNKKEFWFYPHKLKRCMEDACNLYQVILQNTYTKEVFVYKVRDFSANNIRFCFRFIMPECTGDYMYYIVSNNEWDSSEINWDNIDNTNLLTDKTAVTFNGMYLVANGKLVVSKYFKAKATIKEMELPILVESESEDERTEGELVTSLDILSKGLLRYTINPFMCCGERNYNNYKFIEL